VTPQEAKLKAIFQNCKVSGTGCVEWTRYININGYPMLSFKSKPMKGTKLVWLLTKGMLPTKWLLHKCDNRKCLNIDHLYEGSAKDNMRDQLQRNRHHFASRTHCKEGHPLSGSNLIKDGHSRRCRICRNEKRMERFYAKGY
jgi:hypothetical protein